MIKILKDHKWAIILALLTGVIVASPQIYLRYDLGNLYQGMEMIGATGDEEAWLSRLREVQDGHPTFSSAYFKEGKDDPYFFQPLGTIMVAYLGKIFSLDINNTILLSRFLFPFIVFLLVYFFLFFFTEDKLASLSISSVFLLAFSLFESFLTRHLIISIKYLNLTRPVNPVLTWIFFFSFLLAFWLFFKKRQWRYGVLSILALGLSFYDYFYTWTFLFAFCGVLALIFIFRKDWFQLKRIVVVLSGAAILGIPWFYNLYRVLSHPNYLEVGQKFGLVESRTFVLGFLILLVLVVFLLFFPKKDKERFLFGLALLITPLIVLNQQLITGKILSIAHYHWYYHKPLAMIFLLMILFFWLSRRKREFFKKILAVSIIIVSVGNGFFTQMNSYAAHKDGIIENQKYGPLMDWLNMNAEKEEVIFTSDALAYYVVVYTPLNVFYHTSAKYSLAATTERLLNAHFLYYRLNGLSQDKAESFFFKERANISREVYGMIYGEDETETRPPAPDELMLELIKKYKESFNVSTGDFLKEMLQKYEVKYAVWDKKSDPQWQLDQYQFLEKAAEVGDFIIYRFD